MQSEHENVVAAGLEPPRAHKVALDTGLACHVLEWGADRDFSHSVFLVHGFLDLGWGWDAVVRAGLASRFHVVAPDMRGHGDSDRVGAGGYYHFMDYVADLASLVEKLGRARVSLVGHSMGGSITSYYAGAFPKRVARLAVLEGLGPPEDTTPIPERTALWIAQWSRGRLREPARHASVEAAAARLRAHDALLDADLAAFLAEKGTRVLPDGSRQFKHDTLHLTRGPYPFRVDVAESFWQRIECPVLLVEGSESPFRRLIEAQPARLAHFRTLERATLAGAGHMVQRHRPRELAELLVGFLDPAADRARDPIALAD